MTRQEQEQLQESFRQSEAQIENRLCNINRRLKMKFGEGYGLKSARKRERAPSAVLVLPLEREEKGSGMYRVLVVDDEEMITDSLAGMLAETPQFELDVYKAYSGTEALRLLNEFQFDIVVSDICTLGLPALSWLKHPAEMAAVP